MSKGIRVPGLIGIAALLLGSLPNSALAAAGMTPMTRQTVKSIVKDAKLTQPLDCYDGLQAISSKRWGAFWGKYTADGRCQVGEGYEVVHKTSSGWTQTGIGGSSVPCPHLKSKLREAGAPLSVFQDFKSKRLCFNW